MIFLAMEDITDRKREQESKQQLLREQAARFEAERANRRKDEFLAMLAHELRNPLAPILNALLLLRAGEAEPSDTDWALEILERQVRHLTRLVDDLLDVSRVMRGAIELRKERLELADAVSQAVEISRSFIEGRRHQLSVDLPDRADHPRRGPGPPRAGPRQPAATTPPSTRPMGAGSRSSPHARPARRSSASATTGSASPREQIHEIFDLFMQVDSSLERSTGGLGIGLTLVKSLVELHGGTVEARSEGWAGERVHRPAARVARREHAGHAREPRAGSGRRPGGS